MITNLSWQLEKKAISERFWEYLEVVIQEDEPTKARAGHGNLLMDTS